MNSIILVDDQPIANFITRKLLQIEGFNQGVIDFTNPRAALDYLAHQQESLIFLDLNMPDMNGWEFLDAMKKSKHKHQIIILTSSTSDVDRQKARQYSSVVAYVEKPLNKQKFTKIQTFMPPAL